MRKAYLASRALTASNVADANNNRTLSYVVLYYQDLSAL